MRQNLLFTFGVVALLGAGALVSMQDPPKPVAVDWVTVEFNAENCDTNGFDVSWRTDFSSGVGGYVVTGVQLSGVTWFCLKQDITVYLNSLTDGTGGTVLAWAVVPGDPGATTGDTTVLFDFSDAHVSAQQIRGIAVAIPDRTDTDTYGIVSDRTSGAAVATMVYGSKRVYVAGRAVRGAAVPTSFAVIPDGGMKFWYCFGAASAPAACDEDTAGSVLLSEGSSGTQLAPVGDAAVPTAIGDSSTLTPPVVGYYLFRARFVTADYIYYGSEDSGGSGGARMTLQVTKAPTTTGTPTASTASTTWGVPITFTGTVFENVGPELLQPAGRIVFRNGGVDFGSCEVTNNTCSYTTGSLTELPVGTRSITAQFVGVTTGDSANYQDSPVSGVRSVSIFKSDSTTNIQAPSSSIYLAPVTITARVRAKSPSVGIQPGKLVTIRDYTTPTGTTYTSIGSCALVADLESTSGVCSITTNALAVRDHYLVAVFNSTTEMNASASTRALISVTQPTTDLTLTPSPASPSTYGQAVSFTVVVTSSGGTVPNAVVALSDGTSGGTRPLGTCTLNAGTCTFSASSLEVTSHTISAFYAGTASIPAASTSIGYVVDRADATTAISASTTSAVVGQPITFTARVAPVRTGAPTPTGSVHFYTEGGVLADSCLLVAGTCSISITRAASGTDGIWATYQGSASYLPDSSDKLAFAYVPAPTAVAGTWTPTSLAYGGVATLTARVTASAPSTATPTGTVAFSDGTTGIGSCVLSAGACSIVWPDTGVAWPNAGSHTLYFRYLGTGDFSAATQSRSLSIAKVASSIDLSSNTGGYSLTLPAIARNSSLTFGTIVSSSVPATGTRPTGTVTFRMTSSTGSVTTLCSAKTLVARTATSSWADCAYRFTKAGTYRVWVAYTAPSVSNYNSATLSTAYWISVTVNP